MSLSRIHVALLIALGATNALSAQGADGAADSVFARAQRMVTEGQGDAGRALVQRELDAAPAGSPRFVEALYWRASLAATAADAERDYRRIIIEHALSPRAGDALLRMGQLEMARGDRERALEHFRRLALEHSTHPQRARAGYWSAQLLFQAGTLPRACAALADARRALAESDVELRNQVEYYAPRCEGVDTTAAARTAVAPAPAAPRPEPPAVSSVASARWTVQVAAFRTREPADRLRARLTERGHEGRVARVSGLWHVRVGRFETRQAAERALLALRADDINGFVARVEGGR